MHHSSVNKCIKYFVLISLFAFFAVVGTSHGDSGGKHADKTPVNNSTQFVLENYVKGEVLVRYKSSAFLSSKLGYLGATASSQVLSRKLISDGVVSVETIFPKSIKAANAFVTNATGAGEIDKMERWRLLRLADGVDVQMMVKKLSSDPDIDVVELNYLNQPNAFPQTNPNDLYFPLMYGLVNTGQTIPGESPDPLQPIFGELFGDPTAGKFDADIDAELAWQKTNGGNCSGVIVGVIDTGVDTRHTDLSANLWVNRDEIPNNGIDDDNNGYIDDVNGFDFLDQDSDPMDEDGHGTHVAGTIAAIGNNGQGTIGVCTTANIMALRFIGPRGGPNAAAAEAIHYAIDNGAAITNNSWGGIRFSQIIYDAIEYGLTNIDKNDPQHNGDGHVKQLTKMLFVTAAGNDNVNLDTNISRQAIGISYPAALNLPNIITVGASDHKDKRASFSNFGIDGVDLMAPGVNIPSLVADLDNEGQDHYFIISGTSMAAPHVTGVAALVKSNDPGFDSFEPRKLKARLMASVDSVTDLDGLALTEGRLNANRAVDCSAFVSQPVMRLNIENNFNVFVDEGFTIKAHLFDCQDFILNATVTLGFDNGGENITLWDDGAHGDEFAGDGVYANILESNVDGNVTLTATATNAGGQPIATATRTGRITRHYYAVEDVPLQWIAPNIAAGAQLHPYPSFNGLTLTFPANFSFPFYGQSYSEVTVSKFGYLTFAGDASKMTNTSLPELAAPNNMIAVFWDQLGESRTGATELFSHVTGTAPNRTFTITWSNALVGLGGNRPITFQVSLNEGSEDIVMRYLDIDYTPVPSNPTNLGALATVGVEDVYGLDASLVLYNPFGIDIPDKLRNESAIRFSPSAIVDTNSAPTAVINALPQVYTVVPTVFDATGSFDAEGGPLTYIWDMGDGTQLFGDKVTHTYFAPGPRTVTLIVHDGIRYSLPVSTTFDVVLSSPEIVIDAVNVTPGSVASGGVYSLSATIRNIGTGGGFGIVTFLVLDSPTSWPPKFVYPIVANAGNPAIGGGPSVEVKLIDARVPTLAAGSYVIGASIRGAPMKFSAPFNVTVGPGL